MASKAITGERLERRREALGLELALGTLNVRVPDLVAALEWLGKADVTIDEPWSTTGTLRAWKVRMTAAGRTEPAYVTRGIGSRAGALETMAAVHWRGLGVANGDPVTLERGW
jgi:hypothetical protein